MAKHARRPTWHDVLAAHAQLLLPAAHDALTAKLIARAGYPAYQIGGFALEAARAGVPDVDIVRLGEALAWVGEIVRATDLPVLMDLSNGDGDARSIARAVRAFEGIGVDAMFLEDQASPKKCGHMEDKHVLPVARAVAHLKVALDSRRRAATFLMARTDAYSCEGMEGVLRRGVAYLDAGADGLYVEGLDDRAAIVRVAREFSGRALAISLLEGGGKTPWVTPGEAAEMGYAMVLYPTTLLFRAVRAMGEGLEDLRRGVRTGDKGVEMGEFLGLVDMGYWRAIEARGAMDTGKGG
jgi:2-methylisocitrate lyase-like PEP mutase family enzyme